MQIKTYKLPYKKENINLWRDAVKNNEIKTLDSGFYNIKVKQLIENDKVVFGLLEDLSSEYEDAKHLRVKYGALLPDMLDSVGNDLESFINIYNLFDMYSDGMGFFYSNIPDDLKDKINILDTVTFFDTNGNGRWDYVSVNGVKIPYKDFIKGKTDINPTNNDLIVRGNSPEINMCEKELVYVTAEYNFC